MPVHSRLALLCVLLPLAGGVGCRVPGQPGPAEGEAASAPSASGAASATSAASAPPGASAAPVRDGGTAGDSPQRRLRLPFVWDAETDGALAAVRSFLREALADNAAYARQQQGRDGGRAPATERPRVTLVTCSDARVQAGVVDATPEGDLFTVRDLGNQLATAAGTVDYGVRKLKTPLLLILGHTGCTAVKAALGDLAAEPEPVRRELASMDLPRPAKGTTEDQAWVEAVVANVRTQVRAALTTYEEEIQDGRLTVVGAVYDPRGELRKGAGKLVVLDVNGHADEKKIGAFTRALDGDAGVDAAAWPAAVR